MKRAQRKAAGFSLIELLVAASITVFVVATASMALINQYKALQSADLSRQANGENRTALLQIEHSLRLLGWGIKPEYGIDLYTNCSGGTASDPCGRDHTDAPDQLAFIARDPLYRYDHGPDYPDGADNGCTQTGGCLTGHAWWIKTDSSVVPPYSINFKTQVALNLPVGQMVEVTCENGAKPVLLTLGAAVTQTSPGDVHLTNFTGAAPYNDPGKLEACHKQLGAAIFLVNHYRYLIQNISGTNWLMLDTGVETNGVAGIDSGDYIPVAKNVDDLQVAYVYNSSPSYPAVDVSSDGDSVIGDDPGVQEAPLPDGSGDPAPTWDDMTASSTRFNNNPANVRAIRVTLRFHTDRKDPTHDASWNNLDTTKTITIENESVKPSADGFRHFLTQTVVDTRNLESRMPFLF